MKKQFVQKLKSSMEKVKTILSKEEDDGLKCSDYEDPLDAGKRRNRNAKYGREDLSPMSCGNCDPYSYGL